MKNIWENSPLYNFLKPLVGWIVETSFSKVSVEGLENIPDPSAASVIICSNHCNTLMDALLVTVVRRKDIVFAARADIFKNPKVAEILNSIKIFPIYRRRDGSGFVNSNEIMFGKIAECMSHDMTFGIFPEGTHRTRRSLLPIKKGVFRIAERSLQEYPQRPVYIVPAGLEYYDYFNLMRPVKVSFGEPMRIDNVDDMSSLQEELRSRMASLITYFPDDDSLDLKEREFYEKRRPRINFPHFLAAAALLPLFIVSGILCSPILALAAILILRLKDKAWMNTMRFVSRLILTIPMLIAAAIVGFVNLHWALAVLLIIAVAYSAPIFYLILSFYKTLAGR